MHHLRGHGALVPPSSATYAPGLTISLLTIDFVIDTLTLHTKTQSIAINPHVEPQCSWHNVHVVSVPRAFDNYFGQINTKPCV